jgi:hypothetical protein
VLPLAISVGQATFGTRKRKMDKNRRNFFGWLAGFFGLGFAGVATATPIVPRKLEGFIVFFVDVGSLPPFKAEAFINRLKDKWKKSDLTVNWETIWIPSRTQETHAEFYPVNGKKDAEGRLQQIEGFLLDYTDDVSHSGAAVDIDDPLLNLRVVDYVMLMLGAPMYYIDQNQVECAYTNVVEHVKTTGNATNSIFLTENFVREGTLAFAKMFIGRIRIQGDGCVAGSDMALALYEEGRDEVTAWTSKLEEMM